MTNTLALRHLLGIVDAYEGCNHVALEVAIEALIEDAIFDYKYKYSKEGITLQQYLDFNDDEYQRWILNRKFDQNSRIKDITDNVAKRDKTKWIDKIKQRIKKYHKRVEMYQADENKGLLCRWPLGYYEGRVTLLEEILDELEGDKDEE